MNWKTAVRTFGGLMGFMAWVGAFTWLVEYPVALCVYLCASAAIFVGWMDHVCEAEDSHHVIREGKMRTNVKRYGSNGPPPCVPPPAPRNPPPRQP